MTIQVGADWDKDKCVVVWGHDGKLHRDKVKRTPDGVQGFVARVKRIVGADDDLKLEVAIEAGDRYWVVLWGAVSEEVFVFDGKKTRRFGESLCSSDASDDKRSAETLLAMLGSAPHRASANVQLPVEIQGMMQSLAAKKESAYAANDVSNRLLSLLSEFRPSVEVSGKQLRSHWFLESLLLAPTSRAWNELSPDERRAAMSGSRGDRREAMFEAFGKDQIAVAKRMEPHVRTRIRNAVKMLQIARECEVAAENDLKTALEECGALSQAGELPGVGPVIQAALAIAFGTATQKSKLSGQPNRDGAAIILGAAPVTRRSGTMGDAAPQALMRKAGNTLLRAIPYILGLQLSSRHRWAKAAYAYYMAQGKSTATAFRCITRSFLRVLQALDRDKAAFDEDRYIAALKGKGVAWAQAL
jgi:hypothetical protein